MGHVNLCILVYGLVKHTGLKLLGPAMAAGVAPDEDSEVVRSEPRSTVRSEKCRGRFTLEIVPATSTDRQDADKRVRYFEGWPFKGTLF